MPSISVIIPTYNADRTILETIESVQNQTFTDFEIIVINDGSTDRTLEVLQSVSDDRLKIFTYENSGASTARNRGIACAAGDYLTFIDADDLWAPDKLELQLAALREPPEAGVAYSWTIFMQEEKDGSRSLHAGEPVLHQGDVHAELLICNFIASGSNILMRKQVIDQVGLFDTNLARTEDWDYYLRLACK
jgi:glycosyltransferase involved in cell wall biosynthesis